MLMIARLGLGFFSESFSRSRFTCTRYKMVVRMLFYFEMLQEAIHVYIVSPTMSVDLLEALEKR